MDDEPKLRHERQGASPKHVRLLREKCERCGEPFGFHGALPPFTRGDGDDECAGFVRAAPPKTETGRP